MSATLVSATGETQKIYEKMINKRRRICGLPMNEKSSNPGGYHRVLPERTTHDYCAIDTPQVLSYCREAIIVD